MADEDRDDRRDDEEDDERPRRRRRRDDDDEGGDSPRPPQKNGAATAAMVLGVLSFCFSGLTGLPAVIFGIIGMGRAKERGGAGHGTALTGLILGVVGTVFSVPAIAILIGLTLPAVQKVREAAVRSTVSNNFKQIGLAYHNHESNYNAVPTNLGPGLKPTAAGDANPTMHFSWRVAVLPYMEQDTLYKSFDPTQAWNGPKNALNAKVIVKAFVSPDDPPGPDTRIRSFIGKGTMMEPGVPLTINTIPDGASNTWLCAEHRDAVPWPEPNDVKYDAANGGPVPPVPALGGSNVRAGTAMVLFADGSVRVIRTAKLTPNNVRMFIGRNDGFAPNFNELDP